MTPEIDRVATQFATFDDVLNPLQLRVGAPLTRFELAYELYGQMNAQRSNVVLVFHAMTGSQHAAGLNTEVPGVGKRWTDEVHVGWWDRFIGPGRAIDTRKYCVLCVNYLGGCYGSTGPASIRPETGKPWGSSFPALRMCDVVDSQARLLDLLGIDRLHAVVGASLGGFLCLLFAAKHRERANTVIPIGTGIETTIYQRMVNFEQINAIESNPNFRGGDYYGQAHPDVGLAQARRIAHKLFVSPDALWARARKDIVSQRPLSGWYEMNHPIESYMLHQGEKFVRRFDANSYLRLLDAWQWFDLTAEAGVDNLTDLVHRYQGLDFLVMSIDSDLCFPPAEQAKLVQGLKKAKVPVTWITVHSDKGHDAFLLEPRLFAPQIRQALDRKRDRGSPISFQGS